LSVATTDPLGSRAPEESVTEPEIRP
jgi:hypothetical protein